MTNDANGRMEYITIVGKSFDEVAQECRDQQLSEKHFSIVSPIGRHQSAAPRRSGLALILGPLDM